MRGSGFMVEGLGFMVEGLGFGSDLESRTLGLLNDWLRSAGFRVTFGCSLASQQSIYILNATLKQLQETCFGRCFSMRATRSRLLAALHNLSQDNS